MKIQLQKLQCFSKIIPVNFGDLQEKQTSRIFVEEWLEMIWRMKVFNKELHPSSVEGRNIKLPLSINNVLLCPLCHKQYDNQMFSPSQSVTGT